MSDFEVREDAGRTPPDGCECEGLRMPADEGGAARTGAGVRKPSQTEKIENTDRGPLTDEPFFRSGQKY
jgi:hypothetical protein